jgi:hypothetical protein
MASNLIPLLLAMYIIIAIISAIGKDLIAEAVTLVTKFNAGVETISSPPLLRKTTSEPAEIPSA